ncbi:sigma-70 family RNA polymerase sigma factor [Hamadaea sp. NPDC051192]|uniref:sigma-70 family RNA polymerase sigma factor n=1 Tax=Hamadaea sp. NPDC051192 TaxID=3154940 RepID=UPI0034327042
MGPTSFGVQRRQAASAPRFDSIPAVADAAPPKAPLLARRSIVASSKDAPEREDLIASHMPLAMRLARSFAGRGEELDDLSQVAMLELVTAADRYDAARGVPFSQYAQPCILGALKKHFRDRGWNLRVDRRTQELCLLMSRVLPLLTQMLGRHPTISDMAIQLHLPETDIRNGMQGMLAYRTRSLDAPMGGRNDRELGLGLGQLDDDLERVLDQCTLGTQVARLPTRLQAIVRLRFVDDLSQREIADRIGFSQMHVSRLLDRAIDALRTAIVSEA